MSNAYIVPKAELISLGWGDAAKDVVFGGVSWSGHLADLTACLESDACIAGLESQLAGERAERDANRAKLAETNRKSHYGLLATPGYGEDYALLARWGYTRRSEQDSGLTRGTLEPVPSGIQN